MKSISGSDFISSSRSVGKLTALSDIEIYVLEYCVINPIINDDLIISISVFFVHLLCHVFVTLLKHGMDMMHELLRPNMCFN